MSFFLPFRLGVWLPSSHQPEQERHQLYLVQHERDERDERKATNGGNELHNPEPRRRPGFCQTRGAGSDRR